ncbi:hypothetical protein N8I77_000551 [Diaporthe amygdali]|uniref:Uncharacterized protein n=1 Tax=Phomopsis amygdali TaxID=1214568 RepID=A0AAD9W785_PHOAM|nr:hypothetical protein N8I77_000551 [Diaporthe amygdali]
MSDRYGPSSSRRNPRKTSRYESSSDDGQSAMYSEKDGDSDSGGSYVPASTTSSRRRSSSRSHHHHHHRDQSRSSHRSHSHRHHQRSRRHSHRHRQKLLGPAEDGEKPRDSMALAVREEYQVQTVPRAHLAEVSDEEEVYDHRPKPLSHRSRSHAGGVGGARQGQRSSHADKGFFMAAAALAVSLIICCGEVDND